MTSNTGKVYLVGAGPGDPGLLTLRGAECLREADVVLYDYLANPRLLEHAPADAELICLGRHGHGRLLSQPEINDTMVERARDGLTVVRLKGGDPTIFARLAEELAALEAAGIPYEIVPGVSAAQAAGSHAGIPLTQRDDASCVAFVTGRESGGKLPDLDYAALARFPGTLVFYMGITTAPTWSRALIDHGKPRNTPVVIVRHCSLPDQESHFTTLGELAAVVRAKKLRPPAVVIVGEVARYRDVDNWFTNRPLFGRTILVTRPEHQSRDLESALTKLGANVFCQPAIEINPPQDWSPVDDAIGRLDEFRWLVFSSANGVNYALWRLMYLGHDIRALAGLKLAAIGTGTSDALAEWRLRADLSPSAYRSEQFAGELAPHVFGQHVLLVRGSRGREVLPEMLAAAGAVVEQVVAYESRDVEAANADVAEALAAGEIDWVTVTSPAIARNLVRLFGDGLHRTRLAAISPLTAEALSEFGLTPVAVAETYNAAGLADAIVRAESGKL
jgi:uroporphyrinogen III methyltransferase/synthase